MTDVVLVTGGLGFIGSHTCVELLNKGYEIVIVDNLVNSKLSVVKKIEEITDKTFDYFKIDLRDEDGLNCIFKKYKFIAVLHFAGLKSVNESVNDPLSYYDNNLIGTIILLKIMKKYGVKNLIFSGTASVYKSLSTINGLDENSEIDPQNPYARSKLFIEKILKDLYNSDNDFNIIILRYFNPIGAHSSGKIGENPNGTPNNLMPYILKTAIEQKSSIPENSRKYPHLNVYGNDYNTKDGTGIRDYIHVMDLVSGHIKSLELLKSNPGYIIFNLGTGKGYSVLEILEMMKKVVNFDIPYKIVDRRQGDVDILISNVDKAKKQLSWQSNYDLQKMCEDSWNWQKSLTY